VRTLVRFLPDYVQTKVCTPLPLSSLHRHLADGDAEEKVGSQPQAKHPEHLGQPDVRHLAQGGDTGQDVERHRQRLCEWDREHHGLQPGGHHCQRHQSAAQEERHAEEQHAQPPDFGGVKGEAGHNVDEKEQGGIPEQRREQERAPHRRVGGPGQPENEGCHQRDRDFQHHLHDQCAQVLGIVHALEVDRAQQLVDDAALPQVETELEDQVHVGQRAEDLRQQDVGHRGGQAQPGDGLCAAVNGAPEEIHDRHGDGVEHQPDPEPHLVGHKHLGDHAQDGEVLAGFAQPAADHFVSSAPL